MRDIINMLENELDLLNRALEKSKESYDKGDIDLTTHTCHKINLSRQIPEYHKAINILKKYVK